MDFIRITTAHFEELKALHAAYKAAIGEKAPTSAQFERLYRALENGSIDFYGCICGGRLVACCSIACVFSTFHYDRGGVLEDFYIAPPYRHQGIARKLAQYGIKESGVQSLTVGCADCDADMYRAIGFRVPLGHLLAFDGAFQADRADGQTESCGGAK